MNTNWVYIKDLKNHVDELVEFRGWVWNKRSSGKIAFFTIERWNRFYSRSSRKKRILMTKHSKKIRKIKMETSVILRGIVKKKMKGLHLT